MTRRKSDQQRDRLLLLALGLATAASLLAAVLGFTALSALHSFAAAMDAAELSVRRAPRGF